MPSRKSAPYTKAPDLAPERALPVLRRQLDSLLLLKGRRFREIEAQEQEWHHLTQSIVERTFGNPSSNLSKYNMARNAGESFMMPVISGYQPDFSAQDQSNFEARTSQCEAVLRSLISEIELFAPEQDIKGAYEPGDEYSFYRDLKGILSLAQREIFLVDNYLDQQIFDIYVNGVRDGVIVRMLTRSVPPALMLVAEKFGRARGGFEMRVSPNTHDRVAFVDDRCLVIGQSVKDAARSKPTYIVEMNPTNMRPIYEAIWASAAKP